MFRAMSKSLFASSKSALVFAGMTIVGTLIIVGPKEGGGLLDSTVERFSQQRETIAEEAREVSEQRSEVIEPAEPLDPASGWGGTPDPVFGDYEPGSENEVAAPQVARAPAPARSAPVRKVAGPVAPPRAPTSIGGPVRADSPGVLVPRDRPGEVVPPPEAVVTSRTLNIEPQ